MSADQVRLEERIDALEEAVRDVRQELRPSEPPQPSLRPPSPSDVVRVTRKYAIPATIATLEANIRALELFAETLRLVDVGDRPVEEAEATRDRVADVGQSTLGRLDEALDRIESEMDDGGLPDDPEVRDLLREVRVLRDDVDEELAALAETAPADESEAVQIDVESELETIKDEVSEETPDDDQS